MHYVTFDNIDELVQKLGAIKKKEPAYERAQQFLKTAITTHEVEEVRKFIDAYERNR